jgi:hypothetical protein
VRDVEEGVRRRKESRVRRERRGGQGEREGERGHTRPFVSVFGLYLLSLTQSME